MPAAVKRGLLVVFNRLRLWKLAPIQQLVHTRRTVLIILIPNETRQSSPFLVSLCELILRVQKVRTQNYS